MMIAIVAALLLLVLVVVVVLLSRPRSRRELFDQGPDIRIVDGFMTPEECDAIMAIAEPRLEASMVYGVTAENGDAVDKDSRVSRQTWLNDSDSGVVDAFSKKVSELSGLPVSAQEELQVVRYEDGGFYGPHHDACKSDLADCSRMDDELGPRYLTFLVYLNDGFQGGETEFPDVGQKVTPAKGRLVIFRNTDDQGRVVESSRHAALPVTGGVPKWVANKWVHRKP